MKDLYMKKSSIIKLAILAVIAFGAFYVFKEQGIGRANSSSTRFETVKKMDLIQRVSIAGNVVPSKKTIITAPFNGYIKKLYVEIGQKVKKGDPIVSVVQSLQSTDPVFPLRSPLDGTVVSVLKEEGEFVKQDDPKDFILRIDNLDNLYVISNVPEIDMVKIKPGLEAIIKASAILDKQYKGEVVSISLASKNQDEWRGNSKVEYPTKVKITDADESIKPGMSAILDIVSMKRENVLVLPHEFVSKDEGKFFVFTRGGEEKEISVGLQNEAFFEVLSGLSEGDEVKQIDFMELMQSK